MVSSNSGCCYYFCKVSLLVADLTRTQRDDNDKANPPAKDVDSQQVESSSRGLPEVVTQSSEKGDSAGKSHILIRGISYLKSRTNLF